MRKHGITLIEMLIAALIGVAILALIASGLRSGTDSLRFVQNSQLLTEDLRAAGNLVSDYLSTAAFVYPPGTTLTIGSAGGYTVRNQRTNNNTWQIGRDPAVAMLRPVNPSAGEFRFVMVYALPRGWVTSRASGAANPGPDPQNNDKWLLYIYEDSFATSGVALPNGLPQTIPTVFGDSSGRLLADYVQPGGFVVSYPDCLGFDEEGIATLIACPAAPPSPLQAASSAARVVFSLQGEIRQGGRDSRVPANPLSFQAAPRNLAKRLSDITRN